MGTINMTETETTMRCDVCGAWEPPVNIRVLDSTADTWQCVTCIRKAKTAAELAAKEAC